VLMTLQTWKGGGEGREIVMATHNLA